MGQTVLAEHLARRFFAWQLQARTCHRILRLLVTEAEVITTPGDGTVEIRVSAAAWQAASTEAAVAPPEPIDPPPAPGGPPETPNGAAPPPGEQG